MSRLASVLLRGINDGEQINPPSQWAVLDRSSGAFRAWPQYVQLAAAAMVMTIAETIAFEGESTLFMPIFLANSRSRSTCHA